MLHRLASIMLTAAVLVATPVAPSPHAAEAVKLTSLDWQPFTGDKLPGQGAAAAIVTAAFGASGGTATTEFYPWQRAVDLATSGLGYVGYYPEYFSDDLKKTCDFSSAIGTSPLGFVEAKAKPISWASLDELTKYKLGVVRGYVNTAEFDARVAKKTLVVEEAGDDLTNIRKVAAGRIDAAVIDANVLQYMLSTAPSLADVRKTLQFNARPLESKSLHVCFRRDPTGAKARARFEEGLKKIDAAKIFADALKQAMPPSGS